MYQRKLDELGRVMIPLELQLEVGVTEGCALALSIQNGGILLTPEEQCCNGCGKITKKLLSYKALHLCESCVQGLKTL